MGGGRMRALDQDMWDTGSCCSGKFALGYKLLVYVCSVMLCLREGEARRFGHTQKILRRYQNLKE
jgi:hypothetical protein